MYTGHVHELASTSDPLSELPPIKGQSPFTKDHKKVRVMFDAASLNESEKRQHFHNKNIAKQASEGDPPRGVCYLNAHKRHSLLCGHTRMCQRVSL